MLLVSVISVIYVGHWYRILAFGERGAEAGSDDCRIVGVEIDDGGGVVDWVTSMIACARLLATVPSLTTTSMMRISVEGWVRVERDSSSAV